MLLAVFVLAALIARAWGEPTPVPAPEPSPAPVVASPNPGGRGLRTPTPSPTPRRELPTTMRADRIIYTPDVTYAEGHVEVHHGDAVIKADRLELDTVTHQAEATGNVNLTRGRNSVSADRLTYDLVTQRAVMENVVGRGSDFGFGGRSLVSGEVFFWAKSLEWDSGLLLLHDGVITTDDLPPPDYRYHFQVGEVVMKPGDVILLTHAKLFIHQHQEVSTKKQVFSLRHQVQQSLFPQIGADPIDGIYIKETIPFSSSHFGQRSQNTQDETYYGVLHVDYFQNSGLAAGVEDYIKLGAHGNDNLYYYSLRATQPQSDRYQLTNNFHYLTKSGVDIVWFINDSEFQQPGQISPVFFNSTLTASKSTSRYSLMFTAATGSISEPFFVTPTSNESQAGVISQTTPGAVQSNVNTNYNLHYSLKLSDQTTNFLNMDYVAAATNSSSTFLFHLLDRLSNLGPLFDTDLDYEFTTGTASFFVNRIPELSMRTHPIDLFGFLPMKFSLGVGEFEEQPTNLRQTRTDFQATVPDFEFHPWSGARWYAGGGFRQLAYEDGDAEYVLAGRAGWIQSLGDHLTVRFDYATQQPKGFTPFQTDFIDQYSNATAGIELANKDWWQASILGGYDLQHSLFQELVGKVRVNMTQDLGMQVDGIFDPNQHQLQNIDSQFKIRISPEFYLQTYNLYDFINHRMTYADFALTRETHDFLATLAYRGVQQELWLQFSLRSFPYVAPSVGANPYGILQPGGLFPVMQQQNVNNNQMMIPGTTGF
ncbi:MAG: LptA/OstA family protein [Candidatus Xenobia bacterium]